MKCYLTCVYCKKGFDYSIDEATCKNCKERIVDPEIKNLVFAINSCGIKTHGSCEGHDLSHPWITIQKDEDKRKLNKIVDGYNFLYVSQYPELSRWIVGYNLEARKYWIFPEERYKGDSIKEEADIFASFILVKGELL